eukprot:250024-Chlamydomonas_euryale.AAC.1
MRLGQEEGRWALAPQRRAAKQPSSADIRVRVPYIASNSLPYIPYVPRMCVINPLDRVSEEGAVNGSELAVDGQWMGCKWALSGR